MFLDVENPSSADIHKAADYIFHVAEIAGWDHVGVGSDFDGTDNVPIGLEVRKIVSHLSALSSGPK